MSSHESLDTLDFEEILAIKLLIMKILVVEDDSKARKILQRGLTDEGFVVETCGNGDYALALLEDAVYDLVLLDVMLPGTDGWAVLRQVRRLSMNTLVMMVTAKDSVDHRVKGLSLGADDYLVKPFAFAELVARIRALSRRASQTYVEMLEFEDLQIDPKRHQARRADRNLQLSAKEFSLLSLLLEHQGVVLTRTFIVDRIWDTAFDGDSNVVEVNMRRLRSKVDDPFPRKLLHTIRGAGYVIR